MLSDEDLMQVLSDWSLWDGEVDLGLDREISLPQRLHPDLALIVQGVRRCGKSTLLTQLPQRYNIPLANCYYCNFEDPRLLNVLDFKLLSQIVELARKKVPKGEECYFFFDEIQNVKEWEKWLHVQLERPKKNYYVLTGSNSCLLSGEFATALTGRHITVELYPFSLQEYKKSFSKKSWEQYLINGGFPRVLTYDEPYKLLQEYFNDIILRDVLKRVHSRTPDSIKQVMKIALDSCGSELSYRKIAAVIGLTVDTVKSYLEACEQAYLLFACTFFSFSEKKRQIKQKKYYPIDTGLRYAVTNTHGRDLGKSLEILSFLHLKKTYGDVFYWQELNKGEVDFVVRHGKDIIPYQITWNGKEERHVKALDNFYAAYPNAMDAIFITKDNAQEFLMS